MTISKNIYIKKLILTVLNIKFKFDFPYINCKKIFKYSKTIYDKCHFQKFCSKFSKFPS